MARKEKKVKTHTGVDVKLRNTSRDERRETLEIREPSETKSVVCRDKREWGVLVHVF